MSRIDPLHCETSDAAQFVMDSGHGQANTFVAVSSFKSCELFLAFLNLESFVV